jgi:hypothetical protein
MKETRMFRKLNSVSASFAILLLLAGSAAAQKLKLNPSSNGVKFVTPVVITFENPRDYDNFAAGTLQINVSLNNPASGQTLKFRPTLLTEGFRPMADKSKITMYFVIDNLIEPLGDCLTATPSARNSADGHGVDIGLIYRRCDPAPGTRSKSQADISFPGSIPDLSKENLVKGGKNPGGNMNISVGATESFTGEKYSPPRSQTAIVGPTVSSKGSGSPKQQGF